VSIGKNIKCKTVCCTSLVLLIFWLLWGLVEKTQTEFKKTVVTGKIENIEKIFMMNSKGLTLLHRSDKAISMTAFEGVALIAFKEDLSVSDKPWAKYHGIHTKAYGTDYDYVEVHIHSLDDVMGKRNVERSDLKNYETD
jgi:hypothetical protein